MPILHLLILAIVQGLTEFLPISSSGHLILLPQLLGTEDQGQILDVAVHVGTLGAVVLYFWTDVRQIVIALPRAVTLNFSDHAAFMALALILATIPVMVIGLILKLTGLDDAMRSIAVIGWAMLVFGIVLWWFDQKAPADRTAPEWTLRHAIIMGMWQVLALIPGTSRSGITITGGRALGYAREDAAKLAMLMSIPTIIAAGGLSAMEVIGTADAALAKDAAIAAIFAFLSALLALTLMMRLLRAVSFTPYVVYRVILGVILLWIAYT